MNGSTLAKDNTPDINSFPWRQENMLGRVRTLRGYIQKLTGTASSYFHEQDNTWSDRNTLGIGMMNISVLDWSKNKGACEGALDSFSYLSQMEGGIDESNRPKVLDFGANSGDFLLLLRALFPKYDLYGIELQPYALDMYQHALANLKEGDPDPSITELLDQIEQSGVPTIVPGNFFGSNHIQYAEKHGFYEVWGDDLEGINEAAEDYGQMSFEKYLSRYPDPYEELGLDIEDFDIIYMYQFPGNTPVVLDFLAKNCKPGAKIIVNYSDNKQLDPLYEQYPNLNIDQRFGNQCAILEVN